MRLPFLYKKSKAIALVLLGLMAGCPAGMQAGWLASRQNSAKFKIIYWMKYLTFCYV